MQIDVINIGCKKEDLKQWAIKLVQVYLNGKLGTVAMLQNSPVNQFGFPSCVLSCMRQRLHKDSDKSGVTYRKKNKVWGRKEIAKYKTRNISGKDIHLTCFFFFPPMFIEGMYTRLPKNEVTFFFLTTALRRILPRTLEKCVLKRARQNKTALFSPETKY